MAEIEDSQHQDLSSQTKSLTQKLDKTNLSSSFSIWPPSDRTREAVLNRLIETLSNPSVLSKRYGSLPPEEASDTARSIEEEAFLAAGGSSAGSASIDEGIEILQVYSKEISKRMLESVKSRSSEASVDVSAVKSADDDSAVKPSEDDSAVKPSDEAPAVTGEEASSAENESSAD